MQLKMSALDILNNLTGIEIASLAPLQRMLLINDGTLTEILEAAFLEHIELVKVAQNVVDAQAHHTGIFPDIGNSALMERKILLRGTKSGRNYAYAESIISLDGLSPLFRDKLLKSNTPLGRLWLEHKLETFKQIQHMGCQPAAELCRHFRCADTSPLLVRTYHVFSGAKPVMAITEYFPLSYDAQKEIA